MANKNVFGSTSSARAIPVADTINSAGGKAYALSDKAALAQMVMTGVFNGTFYTTAQDQLGTIKSLLDNIGPKGAEFVAKLAVHARKNGYMKDTPAFLLAWLTVNGPQYVKNIFSLVIDNGKMLRNFVQIMRSGTIGRKSMGTSPKNLVKNWILNASTNQLIRASVGNNPSLADIIKMVHPTPKSLEQNAMFKWLINGSVGFKEYDLLPTEVRQLISFRTGDTNTIPNVPFELLTSGELSTENWKNIARNAGWHMTRMNLNTFDRKGLFDDQEMVTTIANTLQDTSKIANAKVFPYQIFTSWMYADSAPIPVRKALESALDFSLQTVPTFGGKTYIFVDVSGSMSSPITGSRGSVSSKIRCVDVAALIASSLLRANPENTEVVMFDTRVHRQTLNPQASVMDNARIISKFGGGGTKCQLPLQELVASKKKGDLIIYVSDNESWIRNSYGFGPNKGTELMKAWNAFKGANPKAKMVCIDLVPNTTTQARGDKSILNVGGFSDAVYDVIANFCSNSGTDNFWVQTIEDTKYL